MSKNKHKDSSFPSLLRIKIIFHPHSRLWHYHLKKFLPREIKWPYRFFQELHENPFIQTTDNSASPFQDSGPFSEQKTTQLGWPNSHILIKVCFQTLSALCPPTLINDIANTAWSPSGTHIERPTLNTALPCCNNHLRTPRLETLLKLEILTTNTLAFATHYFCGLFRESI